MRRTKSSLISGSFAIVLLARSAWSDFGMMNPRSDPEVDLDQIWPEQPLIIRHVN